MPWKPAHPCAWSGCRRLTTSRYCPAHQRLATARDRARRGTATERGYDADWRALSRQVLAEEPVCRLCRRNPATLVDHIIPVRQAPQWRLMRANLQALCASCHQRKHARQRGQ